MRVVFCGDLPAQARVVVYPPSRIVMARPDATGPELLDAVVQLLPDVTEDEVTDALAARPGFDAGAVRRAYERARLATLEPLAEPITVPPPGFWEAATVRLPAVRGGATATAVRPAVAAPVRTPSPMPRPAPRIEAQRRRRSPLALLLLLSAVALASLLLSAGGRVPQEIAVPDPPGQSAPSQGSRPGLARRSPAPSPGAAVTHTGQRSHGTSSARSQPVASSAAPAQPGPSPAPSPPLPVPSVSVPLPSATATPSDPPSATPPATTITPEPSTPTVAQAPCAPDPAGQAATCP